LGFPCPQLGDFTLQLWYRHTLRLTGLAIKLLFRRFYKNCWDLKHDWILSCCCNWFNILKFLTFTTINHLRYEFVLTVEVLFGNFFNANVFHDIFKKYCNDWLAEKMVDRLAFDWPAGLLIGWPLRMIDRLAFNYEKKIRLQVLIVAEEWKQKAGRFLISLPKG